LEFIKLKIDQLVHAEYNLRKDLKAGDPEFEKIRRCINEFGYVEPIIRNCDYTIVGGHQRHKVLKALGYDEVDCVIIDVDKTKEKALNIALNKSAEVKCVRGSMIIRLWIHADLLGDLIWFPICLSCNSFMLARCSMLFVILSPPCSCKENCTGFIPALAKIFSKLSAYSQLIFIFYSEYLLE
jgi:hypothetical protein